MLQDNTDRIFKEQFCDSDKLPQSLNWNKEKVWNHLLQKRRYRTVKSILYSGAAAVILLFVFIYFSNKNIDPEVTDNYYEEMIEKTKRDKLNELELKMSGKEVYSKYCLNCDSYLPKNSQFIRNKDIYQMFNSTNF